MTHFGIIYSTFAGQLNPMTTLAYELKQRSHHVIVSGLEIITFVDSADLIKGL